MKTVSFVTIAFLAISLSVSAQSKAEKQVAEQVEKLRKAMVDSDRKTLESLVSPDLSYGHSSGALDNKTVFIDKFVSGKSDFVTIDLTDQTIQVNGDVAIVRHTLSATTNDNNQPGSVKLKVMLVWQKTKGEWILLARQAVKA